jgi:hypothetical protein
MAGVTSGDESSLSHPLQKIRNRLPWLVGIMALGDEATQTGSCPGEWSPGDNSPGHVRIYSLFIFNYTQPEYFEAACFLIQFTRP